MAIPIMSEDERPLYQRLRTRPPSPAPSAKFRAGATEATSAPETRAADGAPEGPTASEPAPGADAATRARPEPWALAEGDRVTRAIQEALKGELSRMRREAEERLAAELDALRGEEIAKLEAWRRTERERIERELANERAALVARMRKDAAATLRQSLERAIDQALRTEHG